MVLQMTIDARKIISKLSMPLEDKELKKLKNMNWGLLIRETYGDIISLVDYVTRYTVLIAKQNYRRYVEGIII